MAISSWFAALIAYGCVAAPADSTDDDGGNASGSGGVAGTGTPLGGTGGAASGAGGTPPVGGTVGVGGTTPGGSGGAGATTTGGASGAATGGVSGAGVTGGTGGAGVSGAGGMPGGTGGTPASGAGGAASGAGGGGGSTGVNMDAMCKSISNNAACTAAVGDGKQCPMMPCGLGDMGRRDCSCSTNWSCTTCSFVGTVIEMRPANADTACGTDVVAGMPCAMNVDSAASVCRSSSADDPYCMCASNPRNTAEPPEWNCDSKPGPWPM